MIAVALSPKARSLILAYRDARRPTAMDRERVTAALRAQLGLAVLPLDTPPPAPRLMSTGAQRWLATAFGVCLFGSGLLLARQPSAPVRAAVQIPNKPVDSAHPATVTVAPSEPAAVSVAALPPQRKTASIVPHPVRSKAMAPAAQDTLGEEVLLLSSATSQLSSGQASGALIELEEHQRRFPRGTLKDERNAAKARALCVLHRFSEGRATLALLGAGSPFAARAKEECDSASSRGDSTSPSPATERD